MIWWASHGNDYKIKQLFCIIDDNNIINMIKIHKCIFFIGPS